MYPFSSPSDLTKLQVRKFEDDVWGRLGNARGKSSGSTVQKEAKSPGGGLHQRMNPHQFHELMNDTCWPKAQPLNCDEFRYIGEHYWTAVQGHQCLVGLVCKIPPFKFKNVIFAIHNSKGTAAH
jgi:hypothetical protein